MDQLDHVARIQEQWRRERPDLDSSPQGVFGRLHRLAAHLTDELAIVFERHGLSEGEFDVLATLRRAGSPFELTPGELADQTMVTSGAMTKRVDRLIAAGLARRRAAADDGRKRVVGLTAKGRRTIDAAFTEHLANEHRLIAALTVDEQRQLESLLARWLNSFEASP